MSHINQSSMSASWIYLFTFSEGKYFVCSVSLFRRLVIVCLYCRLAVDSLMYGLKDFVPIILNMEAHSKTARCPLTFETNVSSAMNTPRHVPSKTDTAMILILFLNPRALPCPVDSFAIVLKLLMLKLYRNRWNQITFLLQSISQHKAKCMRLWIHKGYQIVAKWTL